MMIPVPFFTPGRQLQRPQPPYIPAGVSLVGMIQVCEAVHKTLHVQRVHQANGADPKKSLPAECQAAAQREQYHRRFRVSPYIVGPPVQFRTPLLTVCRAGLIEPAEVSPPEATVLGAGNVLGGVGIGMMMPVIGDPTGRISGAVEHGTEDQQVLDHFVHLNSPVRQHSMVTDGCPQASQARQQERQSQDRKARQREQNHSGDSQNVYESEIEKDARFALRRFPKRHHPGRDPLKLCLVCADCCRSTGQFNLPPCYHRDGRFCSGNVTRGSQLGGSPFGSIPFREALGAGQKHTLLNMPGVGGNPPGGQSQEAIATSVRSRQWNVSVFQCSRT